MKQLINAINNFVLLVVKEKDIGKFDAFKGCNPSHNDELSEIISNYDEIFQEPKGLPPKREIQHEIQLQEGAPLPNSRVYRIFMIEV